MTGHSHYRSFNLWFVLYCRRVQAQTLQRLLTMRQYVKMLVTHSHAMPSNEETTNYQPAPTTKQLHKYKLLDKAEGRE